MENVGHDIHTLECLFHINEIYFTHVVSLVEGRKKGPGMMQEEALFNKIKSIPKPEPTTENVRENLSTVSITGIALLHLKSKVKWFAEQKRGGLEQKDNFRTDQMCMLVLACSTFMDVPAALKSFLLYKQETFCHSRWITTASGYLRLHLFNSDKLSDEEKIKSTKLISYIVSVYVPSFIMIHLKPKASDGPFLTLFQRDLLFAYRKIDEEVADVVLKYFVEHGSKWLSPKNVALSLFSDCPPFSLNAVKTSSALPADVDTRVQLQCRAARLRNFFTVQSQRVPYVMHNSIPAIFWKTIENNNRCTERQIGKLKNIIQDRVFVITRETAVLIYDCVRTYLTWNRVLNKMFVVVQLCVAGQ